MTAADGPVTVYDLERLTAAPHTVVLPACQSGVTAVRAGDELIGLASALLALGTRSIICTVLPVRDAAAGPLMDSLHRRLRAGSPPATALAQARHAAGQDDPAVYAAARSFICLARRRVSRIHLAIPSDPPEAHRVWPPAMVLAEVRSVPKTRAFLRPPSCATYRNCAHASRFRR